MKKGTAKVVKKVSNYTYAIQYINSCPFCGATENETFDLDGDSAHSCSGTIRLIANNNRKMELNNGITNN